MVTITTGSKKKVYKSIREAANASRVPYMTLYMRLRAGKPIAQSMKKPVRQYVRSNKKVA